MFGSSPIDKKSFIGGNSSISRLRLLLIFFLIAAFPNPSSADTSVNISIDSWVYPALEKLDSFGLIKSGLMNTRPFTRMEVARLTGEAIVSITEREPENDIDGLALYLLERLKREFRDELSILEIIDDVKVKTFIKPIDEAKVKYHLLDGKHAVYNNDGIRYGDHNNASLEFSGRSKFFDIISLYYQPILKYNQELDGEDKTELDLIKGYVKLNLGNIEFEIGRDSLWWGPGHHGSLLMTNNAEPFDMVKISNPRSILLPWIFRYLGPFKITWFITKLEKERIVPEPYLSGLRLNFKPLPVLELGASRVVMMGGEGRSGLDFNDILKIITGENTSRVEEDTSNQIASIDFSVKLGFLGNTEMYGEWGGEDEANALPTKIGYLIGIYVPRITHDGRFDLRAEYANNHVERYPDVWYSHSVYSTGYTYRGSIIGHHMGSDTEDIFIRITNHLTYDLKAGMDFDFEKRGKSNPSPEEHFQFGIDLSYNITDMIEFKGRYGFEKVNNYNFIHGVDKDYHFLGTELAIKF